MDEDELFAIGLQVAGFGPKKLARRTQLRRYREMYGCNPCVVKELWRDVKEQLPNEANLTHLYWALFFLKKYPTEGDLASRMNKDPATIRKWVWCIILGIQELKAEKIVFPTEDSTLIFIVSVDGTDCRIEEPRPFNKSWFSQKFRGPAVKYEVALDVLTGRCVWINGPFQGSKNDLTIFRQGLKHLIPPGKYAIADKGYKGEPTCISFPNHLDDEDIKEFKKRVRARQETFFSRMKSFAVMEQRFRHKPVMEKHKACFEAVAIIVQYSIDNGSPLFSV